MSRPREARRRPALGGGAIRPIALAVPLVFAAAPLAAVSCLSFDRGTAERAVELLERAGELYLDDWLEAVAVERVRWRRIGFRYEVLINDDRRIDFADAYAPDGAGGLRSLAPLVGCEPRGPENVPRQPFERLPGAEAGPRDPPRLVGVVALPRLLGWAGERVATAEERPIRLLAEPEASAEILAEVREPEEIETVRHGYEHSGAVVLRARDGWFEVTLAGGERGWVGPEDSGAFHPLEDLLHDHLSYLLPEWDGGIRELPDPSSPARRLDRRWREKIAPDGEMPVNVVSARWVGRVLWLEVELLASRHCTGEAPPVLGRGWVDAHAADGAVTGWFYAAGC